jgi:hypothetical protein
MNPALCALAALYSLALQDPQEPPPPPTFDAPVAAPEPAWPKFPIEDGLSLRTLMLRPRFLLTTREFDINTFSGEFNVGEVGGLDRTAFGLDTRGDFGDWTVAIMGFQQKGSDTLDEDMHFEQYPFQAGSEVDTTVFYATVEGYYRFGLAGGPSEPFQLQFLAGFNYTRMHLQMESDGMRGREGFSALWPVPGIGLESRLWVGERLSVSASARGTYIKYKNPWQVDGGSAQKMTLKSGRLDLGLEWCVNDAWSIAAGYSGFTSFINDSSAEDTDTAEMKASGLHLGVGIRF